MVCFSGINRSFRLSLCLIVSMLATSPALAKSVLRQASLSNNAITDGSTLGSTATTTARFFTIKQVLAGLDAGRNSTHAAITENTGVASLGSMTIPNPGHESLLDSAPRGTEPFGLSSFQAPNGALWAKWSRLESELITDANAITRCRLEDKDCSPAARRFVRIVDAVKAREGRARIEEANRNINLAIRYVSDFSQHGEPDRWSTPLTALTASRGDCEDYAIAKYMVLKEAGVAAEDLQLVLVRDRRAREDHAVLAVRHDERWLILDNRHASIVTDTDVRHFIPLYAINNDGVKLFAAPYEKSPAVIVDSSLIPAPAAKKSDALVTNDIVAFASPHTLPLVF